MKKLIVIAIASMLLFTACASAAIERTPETSPPAMQAAEDMPVQAEDLAAEPAQSPTQEAVATEAKGGSFASFSAVDTAGNSVDESILSDSKLTVMVLWATYCQPCIMELPGLQTLSADYADSGVQVIGLVRDVADMDGNVYDDQVSLANDITEELGVAFTQLIPSKELNRNALSSYMYTPTTLFLDAYGQLISDPIVGYVEYDTLKTTVDGLLADIEDACPSCS